VKPYASVVQGFDVLVSVSPLGAERWD